VPLVDEEKRTGLEVAEVEVEKAEMMKRRRDQRTKRTRRGGDEFDDNETK